MQRHQAALEKTQNQLATGLRIMRPSDDPQGAARIVNLEGNIAALDQFSRNAVNAGASLKLEESALQSANDVIQRVRELVVQANNSTASASDRNSIAEEIERRLDELTGIANSRDPRGGYIFAGYRSDKPPFTVENGQVVYRGDGGVSSIPVGHGTAVATGDPGDAVFQKIAGPQGEKDLFVVIDDIRDALHRTADGEMAKEDFHDAMGSALGDLDRGLDHINARRGEVGGRLNTIETMEAVNADFKLQLETLLSGTRDLDYSEAVGEFNRQLTALQAAQQVFVRTASLSLFQFL